MSTLKIYNISDLYFGEVDRTIFKITLQKKVQYINIFILIIVFLLVN